MVSYMRMSGHMGRPQCGRSREERGGSGFFQLDDYVNPY